MPARRGLPLTLAVILGAVLLLSNQALSWTVDDPEIRDLGGIITVRDYEGKEELSLEFVYLNDRSLNYISEDAEEIEQMKEFVGGRNCLYLMVFVEQDTYFYPTNITFVQGRSQYKIDYDNISEIDDAFRGGRLRSGVMVSGFVFIPESIDIYYPIGIYYNDDYTIFSVPKEKEADIEEKIKKLEETIGEIKKRINEINLELEDLKKQREQKIQPFFDLYTPENTLKSFMEAVLLEDNEKAAECWSDKIPESLITFIVSAVQESMQQSMQETPELESIFQDPEAMKFFLRIFSYEKEQIDENNYYVWCIFPNGGKDDDPFRVTKEGNQWKIRTLKSLERDPVLGIQEE